LPRQRDFLFYIWGDGPYLLNPATEAYQFARVDGLYRQLAYPYKQTLQLAIFSADNDEARQFLFFQSPAVSRDRFVLSFEIPTRARYGARRSVNLPTSALMS